MPDPNKYPMFRLFQPTEGKILYFAKKLMEEYLYLDDQWRNYPDIYSIINRYISEWRHHVLYEIGEYDGLMGFTEIQPGWKAHMTFKLWNPKRWGADFVRQAKGFIGEIMDELQLIRLESASPDPRIVKMAKMVGFKVEGLRRAGFKWNNILHDDCIFAIIREESDVLSGKPNGDDEPVKPRATSSAKKDDRAGQRKHRKGGKRISGGGNKRD